MPVRDEEGAIETKSQKPLAITTERLHEALHVVAKGGMTPWEI